MAYGAFIAFLFQQYLTHPKFKNSIVVGFLVIGLFLVNGSTTLLHYIFKFTQVQLIDDIANFNYLFIRLGNVLVIFGTFYALERFLKHPIILKIGQKTLSIYVIHFIVLYGSFTGWGLNRVLSKKLDPTQAVFGALIFLILVSLIAVYRIKANTYIYAKLRIAAHKISFLISKRGI